MPTAAAAVNAGRAHAVQTGQAFLLENQLETKE
jgi:hypothetical protein